jgi:hypothetical protein
MRGVAKPDSSFAELIEAFENPDYPGWTIGSAEGGWVIPSEDEWGETAAPAKAEAEPTAK